MKPDEYWTNFQLDAEIETYGTGRIVQAHNQLFTKFKTLVEKIEKLEREKTHVYGKD